MVYNNTIHRDIHTHNNDGNKRIDIMMPFAQFSQNSIHLFSFTQVVALTTCIEPFIPKTYLTVVVAEQYSERLIIYR